MIFLFKNPFKHILIQYHMFLLKILHKIIDRDCTKKDTVNENEEDTWIAQKKTEAGGLIRVLPFTNSVPLEFSIILQIF